MNEFFVNGYGDVLKKYPNIWEFLVNKGAHRIERVESIWRKENIILKIYSGDKNYVFKRINDPKAREEIERFREIKMAYPELYPDAFFFDIDAYLMESIEGVNFFQISESERIKKIRLAGKTLALAYTNQNGNDKMDISKEIEKSFKRYRETRKRFFLEEELRLPKSFFKIFEGVPKTMSHNDLNAANLLFPDSGIKLIDPSEEGYFDIARDIGRYSASCFFNHFDYFGQDKEKSIEIAREFLGFFDEKILSRARYYIAESFLSFLNFETKTVSKNVLKRLSVNMFLKDGEIVKTLEESI